MSESWVRLWAGMTTDAKWRTIARKSGRPLTEVIAVFTHALLIANDADERGDLDGWVTEDVASALDMDEEHVEAIHQAMQGRVIEDGRLSGWDKRQPIREDAGNEKTGAMSAAERKRLQREREAAMSRDVTLRHDMSRDVTQRHAPEAEAEAEAEAETPESASGYPPPPTPVAAAFARPSDGETPETPTSPPDPPPPSPTLAGTVCGRLARLGITGCNPSHPKLLAALAAGATVEEFTDLAAEPQAKGKGMAWVIAAVEGRRKEAAAHPFPKASGPLNGKPIPHNWAASDQGIDRMGRELGMMARGGETYPSFAARIRDELDKRRASAS